MSLLQLIVCVLVARTSISMSNSYPVTVLPTGAADLSTQQLSTAVQQLQAEILPLQNLLSIDNTQVAIQTQGLVTTSQLNAVVSPLASTASVQQLVLSSVSGLQSLTQVTNAISSAVTPLNSSISALQTSISSVGTSLASLTTTVGSLPTNSYVQSSVQSGVAPLSSSLSSLQSTVSGLSSTVSTQGQSISTLNSQLGAYPAASSLATLTSVNNSLTAYTPSTTTAALSSLVGSTSVGSQINNALNAALSGTSSAISCGSLYLGGLNQTPANHDVASSITNLTSSLNNLVSSNSSVASQVNTLTSPANVSGSVLSSISNAASNYYPATSGAVLSSSISSLSTTLATINGTSSTSISGQIQASLSSTNQSISVGSISASSGSINGSSIITQSALNSALSGYDQTSAVNTAIGSYVNSTSASISTGSLTAANSLSAPTLTLGTGTAAATLSSTAVSQISTNTASIATLNGTSSGSVTSTANSLISSSLNNSAQSINCGSILVNGRGAFSGSSSSPTVAAVVVGYTTLIGPAPTSTTGGVIDSKTANGAASSALQLNPSGGAIYTLHNTLDDGSGDIIASRAIAATGDFPAFPALTVPYVRMGVGSNAIPFVQSVNGSGTNMQLALNPGGGKVTTYTNTLDDGSGNLTAKGSLQVNQNGTSTLGLSIQCSPSAAYGFSDAIIGDAVYQAQGNTNALFGFVGSGAGLGSQASLLRLNYTNSSVKTKNNTLDDGSGNMTLAFPASSSTLNGGAARVQIGATADFNSNTYALGVAGPATGAYPFGVMVGTGGGSVVALQVSKFFGVTTKNNTLDDGSGNMLVSSSSSLSYTPSTPPLYVKTSGTGGGVIAQFLAASNLTSGAATSISLGVANTNGANAAWNYVPASSGTSVAMGPVTATSPFQSLTFFGGGGGQLFLGGANQPGVFSKNNTLDDGFGSMNVVGNFTIPSATVQVTSGLTATNTTSGADNTTINNLVDNNVATEYKPNNNASATSNIVTITSATTLYLTKVTIVYPGGGTAYNTPQSVTVNAGGQQQTATCNSSTTANSVQYVSVTFSPAVVCTSFTLQIFAQSSGAGYPPGWLWDCQVFSLNQASISTPARFSNLVSTSNNILDDSTGNMTVGNKLTISGNLIFNSAGTGYLLPTLASSTIALTSQLSNVAFAVISGTGTVTVSGLSQTSGAGFTSTGNQIVIPAGHYYSVTYCLTGAIPANTAGTLTTSLTNSGLFAGSATLSQYNGAIASETFTLDGSYIATGGSQGSTITIATTGFTSNTGASVVLRQLL